MKINYCLFLLLLVPITDAFSQVVINEVHVRPSGADLTIFKLEIYNRWGEIIFESYDVAASWDGTYHGKLVQDGIFTWTVSIKDSRNDNKYEYQGHLNVIR